MKTAAICAIGDEILIGQIVDTNSSHIARALNSIGVRVGGISSIGDDRGRILSHLDNLLVQPKTTSQKRPWPPSPVPKAPAAAKSRWQ